MRIATILAFFLTTGLFGPALLAQSSHDLPGHSLLAQSSKAEVRIGARKALASHLALLDALDKRLDKKADAYGALVKQIASINDELFLKGLRNELSILKELKQDTILVGKVVTVVNRLARNESLSTSMPEALAQLDLLDQGLKGLEQTLQAHSAARAGFKRRLQDVAAGLGLGPTTVSELDPRGLDGELSQLRTIISSTITVAQLLR